MGYEFTALQIILVILGAVATTVGIFLAFFSDDNNKWWLVLVAAGILLVIFTIWTPDIKFSGPRQVGIETPTPQQSSNNASGNIVAPKATEEPKAEKPIEPTNAPTTVEKSGFIPDWRGFSEQCPNVDTVLKTHGLNVNMLTIWPVDAVWEPCSFAIELKPEFVGKVSIPTINGFQYTAALTDESVRVYWGGDPDITKLDLLWGTTFRWGPTYVATPLGSWLDPKSPYELMAREWRFNAYHRTPIMVGHATDAPYFGRLGPVSALNGNLNIPLWTSPALDQTFAQNWLQAAALYGGRAIQSEWKSNEQLGAWAWKHSKKGNTYVESDFYWQSIYVPKGCIASIWYDNATKDFTSEDQVTLLDGRHNVDEFSIHCQ